MDTSHAKPFLPAQLSAGLLAFVAAGLGLLVWLKLKLWSMDVWSGISISFMPLALGLAAGLAVRLCIAEGTFGLAGFVAGVTLVASLAGAALQHRVEVEFWLQRLAATAYDETREYAEATAGAMDESALRRVLTNRQVAVVGRLAHQAGGRSPEQYWRVRNLYHLHWLASRQIILYGQGGVTRTIWEATQVRDGGPLLHQIVRALANKPISEEDLTRFKEWEQPFLERVAANSLTRQQFEAELVGMGHRALDWRLVAFHGLGPFLGLFTAIGAVTAFRLVRRSSEAELI